MGANILDLIASTNGRMHVHAMSLAARCKTLVFNADQLPHVYCLFTVRCKSYPYAAVHMHARRRHARFLFFFFFFLNCLPLTCRQAAAGFADVCPRSASNTGYSHASVLTLTFPHSLMKWETETLEPSGSPQCLTAHMGLKCVPCLNVSPPAQSHRHVWFNTFAT